MKAINISGKRKKAIARAVLKQGNGVIRVNKLPIELVKPKMALLKLKEPLILAGDLVNKIDISVKVTGGGPIAQAEAARLAIAKALVKHTKSEKLKQTFLDYDRNMLIADVRQRESRKPNTRGKARQKKQLSKR